jgi:hypothetical protein
VHHIQQLHDGGTIVADGHMTLQQYGGAEQRGEVSQQ